MIYTCTYKTPERFSDIIMSSDGEYLTGLWFESSMDSLTQEVNCGEKDLPIFRETSRWLDLYFGGNVPAFLPKYRINNLTSFRKEVTDIVRTIPCGKVLTYNEIAKIIVKGRGIEKMSAQAVGGAVGWNPICIIIPCHRVVGANGKLTGYVGGLKNKLELLRLEGIAVRDGVVELEKLNF